MDSHCTRCRSDHAPNRRRARSSAGIQRTAGHILGATGNHTASQYHTHNGSSPSLLNPAAHQHHPQQVRFQSSSCRAIKHRRPALPSINARSPIGVVRDRAWFAQRQSARRVGPHPSARSNMSSPRTTVPHTMPHPYSACRCRNRIPVQHLRGEVEGDLHGSMQRK